MALSSVLLVVAAVGFVGSLLGAFGHVVVLGFLALTKKSRNPLPAEDFGGTVTVVVPVHQEVKNLRQKCLMLLNGPFPVDRLQIIVAADGPVAVESVKKGILNTGFSLIHMPYPCPTNFGARHLGNRKPVDIYRWILAHTAPLGQEKEDTFWATGIWHDASNSRPEHSQLVREMTERIQRTGKI